MSNYLYDMTWGASGFSLVIIGITCFIMPHKERIRFALGIIYTVSGLLFLYSAIAHAIKIDPYAELVSMSILFYLLGQGIFEMAYFILGDNKHGSLIRKTYHAGLVWTVVICLLPWLDTVLALPPAFTTIGDTHVVPFFHYIVNILAYFWPLVSTIGAWFGGYVSLPEKSASYRASVRLLALISLILGSLLVAIVGDACSVLPVFYLGSVLLQLSIICFYFYDVSHPELFTRAKEEILEAREKKRLLDKQEELLIREGLERLVKSGDFLFESSLTLTLLATRLGVSTHQLSYYFNTCVGTGFSAWHNKTKIERAKKLLADNGDASIIEIAFDCGFGSKTVFNEQFKRLVGMTPTEFRATKKKPRGKS
jgi:AraC-like DNA-binding protein